jgi:hypothetical protein
LSEMSSDAPRRSTGQLAAITSEAPKKVSATQPEPAAPAKTEAPAKINSMTDHQRSQLGSTFGDSTQSRKRSTLLGTDSGKTKVQEEQPAFKTQFDGERAPNELSQRDLWKAATAPVQNREGHRSKAVLTQVLNQFAVGKNPRYDPDAPNKPRGHIFVWDVSRAMGCEVPHFVGAKELSLAQTVDWLRHEGPMRGWRRLDMHEVFEAANEGYLVLAIPKDIKLKHLGIVPPQAMNDDARPLVTGAGITRGTAKIIEMFGHKQAEFFVHA